MNTTEITTTEINRLAANAAGYFVDDEGDLCFLHGQAQIDASIAAEERLTSLVSSDAVDLTAITVSEIKSALGVNRVPADFERTIGRKLDSIQEQAQELAETTSTEISGVALITTENFLAQLQGEGFEVTMEDIHALTAENPELFFANWPECGDAWTKDGMDAIREQLKSVAEVALSSTCRYCGTTVTWSEEATIPTDGNGLICCDGCFNEATGYGAYPESI